MTIRHAGDSVETLDRQILDMDTLPDADKRGTSLCRIYVFLPPAFLAEDGF